MDIITPDYLEKRLQAALVEQANLEQRNYLGMSSIGQCARKLFLEMKEGRDQAGNDRLAWYSYAGQMHEHSLIRLLGFGPPMEQIEVVANFDDRFRGHVDFILCDSDRQDILIECKSVDWSNFTRLYGGPKQAHIDQVQMYLAHGGWNRAMIIYTARDIVYREWAGVPIKVFEILPHKERQDFLNEKAQDILERLDSGAEPPECECGWCRKSG